MVVQHNLTAMNSNRMLGLTTKTQAKSTEKLSSGYKINRAADDAAGLSISEKMRKQIRGLSQASLNAQDGISAVQTAEGALNEVQDMLQRMNELAVKAANGTNSEDDRSYIQNEIDQLTTEIDRVAETTKFNETYLLKGDRSLANEHSYSYKNFKAAQAAAASFNTDEGTSITLTYAAGDAIASEEQQNEVNDLLKSLRDQGAAVTYTSSYPTGATAQADKYTLSLNGAAADKYTVNATTTADQFEIKNSNGQVLLKLTASGATAPTLNKGDADKIQKATIIATSITAAEATVATAKYYDKDGNAISANALSKYFDATTNGTTTTVSNRADAPDLYDAVGNKVAGTRLTNANQNISALNDVTHSLALTLHVGADATDNNQITLNIDTMSAKGLGVNGIKVDGDDDTNARNAVETVKAAIQKVSTQRSALGAIQNRLEHTINNLDNVVENTTSAESQIRDTDMATEMVKYSNNNILAQAGQAMLAQANQSNQGVLSLLG